jgi:hypothetical protein
MCSRVAANTYVRQISSTEPAYMFDIYVSQHLQICSTEYVRQTFRENPGIILDV